MVQWARNEEVFPALDQFNSLHDRLVAKWRDISSYLGGHLHFAHTADAAGDADGGWHMSRKHETLTSAKLFYCFVDFAMGTRSPPFTYVVPAPLVATTLALSHTA